MFLISSSMFLGTPKSIRRIGLFFLTFRAFSIAPLPIKGSSVDDDAITISAFSSSSCRASREVDKIS